MKRILFSVTGMVGSGVTSQVARIAIATSLQFYCPGGVVGGLAGNFVRMFPGQDVEVGK
jgi:hypothetical protein